MAMFIGEDIAADAAPMLEILNEGMLKEALTEARRRMRVGLDEQDAGRLQRSEPFALNCRFYGVISHDELEAYRQEWDMEE